MAKYEAKSLLITSASGIDRFWVGHQTPGIEKEETYIFGFKFKNLGNLDGKRNNKHTPCQKVQIY